MKEEMQREGGLHALQLKTRTEEEDRREEEKKKKSEGEAGSETA